LNQYCNANPVPDYDAAAKIASLDTGDALYKAFHTIAYVMFKQTNPNSKLKSMLFWG
jgi:hypothetical protein